MDSIVRPSIAIQGREYEYFPSNLFEFIGAEVQRGPDRPYEFFLGADEALINSRGLLKEFHDEKKLRNWATSDRADLIALVPEKDDEDTTPFKEFTFLLQEKLLEGTIQNKNKAILFRVSGEYHGVQGNNLYRLLRRLLAEILEQLPVGYKLKLNKRGKSEDFNRDFDTIISAIDKGLDGLRQSKMIYIIFHDLKDCFNNEKSGIKEDEIPNFINFLENMGKSKVKVMLTGRIPTQFKNNPAVSFMHQVSHEKLIRDVTKPTNLALLSAQELKCDYLDPIGLHFTQGHESWKLWVHEQIRPARIKLDSQQS